MRKKIVFCQTPEKVSIEIGAHAASISYRDLHICRSLGMRKKLHLLSQYLKTQDSPIKILHGTKIQDCSWKWGESPRWRDYR